MKFEDLDERAVIQTLQDAQCDEAVIKRFLQFAAGERWEEAAKVLAQQRCQLVCALHAAQKPIDILDYLLYLLKKEQIIRAKQEHEEEP